MLDHERARDRSDNSPLRWRVRASVREALAKIQLAGVHEASSAPVLALFAVSLFSCGVATPRTARSGVDIGVGEEVKVMVAVGVGVAAGVVVGVGAVVAVGVAVGLGLVVGTPSPPAPPIKYRFRLIFASV
jgi:hypothetical protein